MKKSGKTSILVGMAISGLLCSPTVSADMSQSLIQSLENAGLSPNAIPVLEQEMNHENYAKNVVAIVDYTLPSSKPRFFVIHLDSNRFDVYNVAHGAKSGDLLAESFSNSPGSDQSSLGFIKTGSPYYGKFGYSMHLKGISPSDSKIAPRDIIIHSATYSSTKFLNKYGFWGRSFGCLALPQEDVDQVIDTLGSGALILAYQDKVWPQVALHPTYQSEPDAAPPTPATTWEEQENNDGDPYPAPPRRHDDDDPYYHEYPGDMSADQLNNCFINQNRAQIVSPGIPATANVINRGWGIKLEW
jgi:hypothetical protein